MIKKIRNKKAVSHVEVIISFVIFIGFLVFLFAFLNPIKSKKLSDNVLDKINREIIDFASVNYSYISFVLDDSLFSFQDFINSNCFGIEIELDNEVIVRDKNNNIVSAENDIGINRVYITKSSISNNKFYTIYASDIFSQQSLSGCFELDEKDYNLGLLRKEKVLYLDKLINLKNLYESDYNNLKKRFDIPSSNDFGFSVREANGEEIIKVIKKRVGKINVVAKDFPVQILNQSGAIKYVIMNVQAW